MPYCDGRLFYDADSHIMETPDWLSKHVDPEFRDRLSPFDFSRIGWLGEAVSKLDGEGAHDEATARALEADVIGGPKGYEALGASNPAQRSRALDLIGVEGQLIFSGLSVQTLWTKDLPLKYAAARAHNRAMAAFCADDCRMFGVGIVPLHDPAMALEEVRYAIEIGCSAIWVRAQPDGDRSPGHPDLDPIWAHLEETGTPFVVHIGLQRQQVATPYINNGAPPPKDFLGGGEVIRSKDYMTYHQLPETFLSCLVLDGVLDRFPRLRGAGVEFGLSWVPGWLQRLDHVLAWGRSEPNLLAFSRTPREQVIDQMTFTPLPFEDVGLAIRTSSPDLYMFATDYPHVEGSRDPLGKMSSTLDGFDDDVLEKFYAGNFARMMGLVQKV